MSEESLLNSQLGRVLYFRRRVQTGCGAGLASYSTGTGELFSEARRSESKFDHPSSYSGDVRHEWYFVHPFICFDGFHRDNFYFSSFPVGLNHSQ
jgi:hypothetical protein